jgi:hypothetical protein
MCSGRAIAVPDPRCPALGREPARRSAVLTVAELEPDEPDVTRDEEPEEDPPEPELDPPRGAAVPLLPLDDEEGVREPAGVWARGISTTRAGSGALDPALPEEPDEPDELDPELVGRGIAWARAAAGTANAIARARTTSKRGFLSMTMHSFNRVNPTGRLLLQTLQQYCHQRAPLDRV